jgi:hypothetical protein
MSGSPTEHAVNVLAVIAAPVSFWVQAAPIVTVVAGTCGILWYGVLFYREFKAWLKRKDNQL